MVLVIEKTKILETGRKAEEKTVFDDLAQALRYAAKWMERFEVVGAEVWKKKVKFGFYTIESNGDEHEITIEEIKYMGKDPE